ncbi:MAG: helix-turn-helix domain-containing protein [Candidatus Asgardarchaeia archaeon]
MIVDLLKTGESEKVEFKRSVGELKEIIETVVAFANANGGWIFIGVDDSGAITRVKIGKDTIEKLVNNIVQMTNPSIYPSIDLLDINN